MTAAAVALLAALAAGPAAGAANAQQPGDDFNAVFDSLRRITPRADRIAAIQDFVLRRDTAEFHLAQGKLHLLSSVNGRTFGAVFTGTGRLVFRPPLEIERNTMRRIIGDSALNAPITAAVFLFTDTTLAELERRLVFGPGTVDPAAQDRVNDALGFLVAGRERVADVTLMTALLNGSHGDWFAGYVKRARGEDLMVYLDHLDPEEVRLLRRGRIESQIVETVAQFQRDEDRRYGVTVAAEQPDPMRVDRYVMEARIDNNYNFSAKATLDLVARRRAGPWARFTLYWELEVDSVLSASGQPLTFSRRSRSSELWVRLDAPLDSGQARSFRIVYHGSLIEFGSLMRRLPGMPRTESWAFIKTTWSWFPRYGQAEPASMDLTFRTPKNQQFVSIGRLMDSREEGNERISHWVTELPTRVASFNIGSFEQFQITDRRIPPVSVLINQEAHRQMRAAFPHSRNSQEQVGGDIANSLAFFATTFGPPLFERYTATEIPMSHGQAFPGLIHLSFITFLGAGQYGSDESFRAHEMAHQWWGIGVEPAGYRDTWLAEGFSEFSGLWYMQLSLGDNENYFRQLREARTAIRRVRETAAPIGLGTRAGENEDGQYTLAVYAKGAWVLHMLRAMLLDTRTMNEDRFKAMMREFYTTYRGRRASTQDFQAIVEQHLNLPMDWFFRQWVYGTDIPTWTFSWTNQVRDGANVLRFRIKQENVPPDFVMLVPLLIKFGEEREAMVRVYVRGTVSEAEIPLPAAPVEVELNPLESVLAEVRTERWSATP